MYYKSERMQRPIKMQKADIKFERLLFSFIIKKCREAVHDVESPHLLKTFFHEIQMNLDLRNCDLRKNLYLRKIVPATKILVHKLFDFF